MSWNHWYTTEHDSSFRFGIVSFFPHRLLNIATSFSKRDVFVYIGEGIPAQNSRLGARKHQAHIWAVGYVIWSYITKSSCIILVMKVIGTTQDDLDPMRSRLTHVMLAQNLASDRHWIRFNLILKTRSGADVFPWNSSRLLWLGNRPRYLWKQNNQQLSSKLSCA
jgi:hypothetical protein